MVRKRSEAELRNSLKKGVALPLVHKVVDKAFRSDKTEGGPDMLVGYGWTPVECKQGSPNWDLEFSELQDASLRLRRGWVYLLIGEGRAPKGISAFLFPYLWWVENKHSLVGEFKSIRKEGGRVPSADVILKDYRLEWTKARFEVPPNHPWWADIKQRLETSLQEINTWTQTSSPLG